MKNNIDTAYLATGCFWCSEAVFSHLKGVISVTPGYSGGNIPDPSYEMVSTGTTGHSETAKINFDPDIISFTTLLDVFWTTHDPTSLDRQGADIGSQYRSVIFYTSDKQKEIAEKSREDLEESKIFNKPIVTEIKKFTGFYPAEDYHRKYYENHPDAGYCRLVINPKIRHLREKYGSLLK